MNAFAVAAIAMLVAVVPCAIVIWLGAEMEALIGYQAIGAITVLDLILLPEGLGRSGEFELPVLLAVLILGSGLVFVRFLERGL